MNAVTFDTLKYANRLKKAGFTSEQAEEQAGALSEVLEVNLKELATKGDLALLKAEMKSDLERTKVELIKWNVGAIIAAAGLAMAIARLFFHP